jgi:hypothetical protein
MCKLLYPTSINYWFSRKIVRKIFGPSKEKNSWRIQTNQELNQLINHNNLIHFIKTLMVWICRMSPIRSVNSLYSWKPLGARPVCRPKTHWKDHVKSDMMMMKVPNWKTIIQDRTKWKGAAEKTKTLWVTVSKSIYNCTANKSQNFILDKL